MKEAQRHVGRLIKRIDKELARQINNEMRPRGITMQQMRVLIELQHSESYELSSKQLEARLGCAQSTVWGLVSRLEQKDLVASLSSSADARAKMVRLCDKGLKLCETAYGEMQEHERQLTSKLTPQEAEQLRELLERVYEGITELN